MFQAVVMFYKIVVLIIIETKLKQRASLKFCFKNQKTLSEIYNLMKQVYDKNYLSRPRVFE